MDTDLTTLLTGFLLIVLGIFKLGGLARFLPYPVIGGFLAGSGWLLIQGGIGIMANVPVGSGWFHWNALKLWMPGFILGIIVYFSVQKQGSPTRFHR